MLDTSFNDSNAETHKEALARSIRTISSAELKELGERLFPYISHPWRDPFFDFLKENAGSTFHHASTKDGIKIVYCADKDKGIWYVENGMGLLQERGRSIMKAILQQRRS